jgi:tetratricopeptide (TPR) repeat protein
MLIAICCKIGANFSASQLGAAMDQRSLAEFTRPLANLGQVRTPGSLLDPAAGAVRFAGRAQELVLLQDWRDSPGQFGVMLVTGEAGEGKTRLAGQFAARAIAAGWVCGFLAIDLRAAAEARRRSDEVRALSRQLRATDHSTLVVVDRAETQHDEVATICDELRRDAPRSQVRLLLLSQAAPSWWNAHLAAPASACELAPLASDEADRRKAYRAALIDLAARLAEVPRRQGAAAIRSWEAAAAVAAEAPLSFDDPQLGNALTLQMTALANLITVAAEQEPALLGRNGERDLIRHECDYLRRSAAELGLNSAGPLPELADHGERVMPTWPDIERALAGLFLLGPCRGDRASAIAALASSDHAAEVAAWMAALYPPPDNAHSTGAVQPDRIAELLLGPILIRQPGLLGQVAALVGPEDAIRTLFILTRTAAHPEFAQVGDQIRNLIADRPYPFAEAALVVATTLTYASPLREGFVRLGRRDPQQFIRTVYKAAAELPDFSLRLAQTSASLTEMLVGIVQILAEENPATYQMVLADLLLRLGVRLMQVGRRQEALEPGGRAVAVARELAEQNPKDFLSVLANSLTNLGGLLVEAGKRKEALGPAREAVDVYRVLAERNRDAFLPGLAAVLTNLSNRLGELGQYEEALVPGREAVDISRVLAEQNATLLPDVALSLINLGSRLGEAGKYEEAVVPAWEAADIYRILAERDRDTFLPDLATTLLNLGSLLGDSGRHEAALATAQEAASLHRMLTAQNPGAFRPNLAKSLASLDRQLTDAGKHEEALALAREVVSIRRTLAEEDPDAFLSALATSLADLVSRLQELGKDEEALGLAQEAVGIQQTLAQQDPDAFLPSLAMSLNNLGNSLRAAGDLQAALDVTRGSVSIRRALAEQGRDDPRGLAAALANLAARLTDVGQWEPAQSPAREAVDLYRALAQQDPENFLPYLVTALANLSRVLSNVGEHEAALVAVEEAVPVQRALAERDRDSHLPDLARNLAELSLLFVKTGQREKSLGPTEEAVHIYGGLAERDRNSYLPYLARSLTNLGAFLAEAGEHDKALGATQEAVKASQSLAERHDDAYLPILALSLMNLSQILVDLGRQSEALGPAREATDAYLALAAGSSAYLSDLAQSLGNLGKWLTEMGRPAEANSAWESAVDGLPDETSRLSLTVAYGSYLLQQDSRSAAGADLLVAIVNRPDVPGPVTARARQMLRREWQRDPRAIEQAWCAASTTTPPDWLRLTERAMMTVSDWVSTPTWTASLDYFQAHIEELMAPAVHLVLDELALINPEPVIERHRGLLADAHEHGADAAYATVLLADALRSWTVAPDLEASSAFLKEHPEFFDEDTPRILTHIGANRQVIAVHSALLSLAGGEAGIDDAYRCLSDEHELDAALLRALAGRSPAQLQACALIEIHVYGKAFSGAFHMALAFLLASPDQEQPDLMRQLAALAENAGADELERAREQLADLLLAVPGDSAVAEQLQAMLGSRSR